MATTRSRAVLITGCSTGIGRATALHLAAAGWPVFATARRLDSMSDLERAGCRLLALDVSDETSMRAAVDVVEREFAAVGVLVNNAGYSQGGPIESVPMDLVRKEFETNVFGLARLSQLVLPGMRRQRWGKIVNVSSMGGRFTFPGAGYYHASKAAVESISDALRFEVAGFGIDVIVIEPGITRTSFSATAVGSAREAVVETSPQDPYREFNAAVARSTRDVYERGPLALLGGGPETVARTIERAIMAERPRARYRVTPSASLLIALRRLLPDRAWDRFLRTQFPQPE